jgi:hypothetical protein
MSMTGIISFFLALLILYNLRIASWCDEAFIKRSFSFLIIAVMLAFCSYIFADGFQDLKTGETGRNIGRRPVQRENSPNRYWISVSFKLIFGALLVFLAYKAHEYPL